MIPAKRVARPPARTGGGSTPTRSGEPPTFAGSCPFVPHRPSGRCRAPNRATIFPDTAFVNAVLAGPSVDLRAVADERWKYCTPSCSPPHHEPHHQRCGRSPNTSFLPCRVVFLIVFIACFTGSAASCSGWGHRVSHRAGGIIRRIWRYRVTNPFSFITPPLPWTATSGSLRW